MRVKICGITQIEQAQAIASLGVDTLGFICFPPSPRYVNPAEIRDMIRGLPESLKSIGVFVNAPVEVIKETVELSRLTGVQLHGEESPEFCTSLRQLLPKVEIIKAFRVKNTDSLNEAISYSHCVDSWLLDAYEPGLPGGTGKTLAWHDLQSFVPPLPWLLAGGLTPENILLALSQLQPDGIDLSSGVERSPGDKDVDGVARLLEQLKDSAQSGKKPRAK